MLVVIILAKGFACPEMMSYDRNTHHNKNNNSNKNHNNNSNNNNNNHGDVNEAQSNLPVKSDRGQSYLPVKSDRGGQSNTNQQPCWSYQADWYAVCACMHQVPLSDDTPTCPYAFPTLPLPLNLPLT